MNFLSKNKKYLALALILIMAFNFAFLPLTAFAVVGGDTDAAARAAEKAAGTGGGAKAKDSAESGGTTSWIVGKVFLAASAVISTLLGTLFGGILAIEAKIIDYVLSPDNFSFTNAAIVQIGWRITRDLANMFFILILLVIAFATVLRYESYTIKQLWFKVLIAAILINFSLVIAGLLVDFSQVMTTFFIKQGLGSDFPSITGKLANAMKITNFYSPSDYPSRGLFDLGSDTFAAVAGIILTLIGLVVTVFVFGATAVFLIARIVNIWYLLIFAPIMWVFMILPATSSHFGEWWKSFIKWTFFAPVYAFFIYLSLLIFDTAGNIGDQVFVGKTPEGWGNAAAGLTNASMSSAIFQWIVVIYMMIASLLYAQKAGVTGAKTAVNTLNSWGTGAKNMAGRLARRGYVAATRPEAPEPPPAGASMGQRFKYRFRQVGAAVGRGTLAVPGLREQQLRYMGEEDKAYKEAYDKYKGLDPALLNQVAAGVIVDPRARLAVEQLRIEKDQLKPGADETLKLLDRAKGYGQEAEFVKMITGKLGQVGWESSDGFTAPVMANLLNRAEHDPNLEQGLLKQINEEMKKDLTAANGYDSAARENLIRRSQKYGKEKDFAKFFPDIAADVLRKAGETKKEAVSRILSKIENAADIYEDQLVADVVRELNPTQLRSVSKSGSVGQQNAVKSSIINNYNSLPVTDLNQIVSVFIETDKQKREQLRAALPENLRKISHQVEIVTTPQWEHNI
ncbi:MAG: hypothetical protein UV48_C0008G0006 [Candidatus Azambacteria bacterium GW2011_GWA2_42_9]|uniref:Uncharacterized protein n=1 Tax=Candidatus Azambacteria bacterium GW2011_GWA2_42_9 TaxID=1618613 RepID=A0A0G1DXX4_9BACT|nr:MAG: hypothetical protein UV48_C0008G0006 [Candidatus Azambacteria bacterium GW2011_GWA2_42_9]KKS88571.1 MAG: hypothetical protein UV62_C0005G0025 [Parcubacteria group bacterium GW2011_GWC1_43_11]